MNEICPQFFYVFFNFGTTLFTTFVRFHNGAKLAKRAKTFVRKTCQNVPKRAPKFRVCKTCVTITRFAKRAKTYKKKKTLTHVLQILGQVFASFGKFYQVSEVFRNIFKHLCMNLFFDLIFFNHMHW